MTNDDAPPPTTIHVRRAVDGDSASLDWLVRRLSPLLLAQASYRVRRLLDGRYDPEDLVNEVWLIVLGRLGDLRPRDGRFTPVLLKFLSTTLLHRLQKLTRKHLAGEPLTPFEPGRSTDASAGPIEGAAAEMTGVVSIAVRHELQSTVNECLAALPETDREILVLRGIEQVDTETVAMLLGIKPNAVYARYHRALKRLRERLPGSVFDELSDD